MLVFLFGSLGFFLPLTLDPIVSLSLYVDSTRPWIAIGIH